MLQKEIEYSIIPNQSLHTNHYKIRKNLNFEFPYFFSMPKTSCLNPKKTLKTAYSIHICCIIFYTHNIMYTIKHNKIRNSDLSFYRPILVWV